MLWFLTRYSYFSTLSILNQEQVSIEHQESLKMAVKQVIDKIKTKPIYNKNEESQFTVGANTFLSLATVVASLGNAIGQAPKLQTEISTRNSKSGCMSENGATKLIDCVFDKYAEAAYKRKGRKNKHMKLDDQGKVAARRIEVEEMGFDYNEELSRRNELIDTLRTSDKFNQFFYAQVCVAEAALECGLNDADIKHLARVLFEVKEDT